MKYVAGWDTEEFVTAWTFDISGAYTASNVAITNGTYCHYNLSSVMGTGLYTDFDSAFQSALNSGGRSGFNVAWDEGTGLYTINRTGANFGITFDSADMRKALGFTANLSGSNTYTSTVLPYYYVVASLDTRSKLSGIYEPDEIVQEAVSSGGSAFGLAKDTTETWEDWYQMFEPRSSVMESFASSSAPYTFEAFVKHVRGHHPFLVLDQSDPIESLYFVHKMREETATFNGTFRSKVAVDWENAWNLNFRTRRLGTI